MTKTLLVLITVLPLVLNVAIADDTPSTDNSPAAGGLRDSEKEFLKQLQDKSQTHSRKNTRKKDYQYIKEDETEYSQCQTALTKIDKLILEVNELNGSSDFNSNNLKLKIKSLESQIERYKTEAKQFCAKELLNQSMHM